MKKDSEHSVYILVIFHVFDLSDLLTVDTIRLYNDWFVQTWFLHFIIYGGKDSVFEI